MVVERHICQIDLNCKTVKLMYWGQLSELSCHSLIIGKIQYNHKLNTIYNEVILFHLHCDYILPALLNTIFISSNRIQCLNFVSYNDLISGEKKLCVDDPVALTGGCYKFVSK